MKLLTSVFPRTWRVLPASCWFTLAVCGFLIGLEVLGRFATSDFHDALAAFALVGVGLTIAIRHRKQPLSWVSRVVAFARRVVKWVAWLRYDHGIDLRGTPPLPRRTPPVIFLLAAILLGWCGLAVGAWIAFPTGWRIVSFYSSYTLYLVFLLALWGLLLAITFVGVVVPVAALDRRLRNWVGDTDRRGAELAAVVGYLVLASSVASVVPPVYVIWLCAGVVVLAWLAYLPKGKDSAALLWRPAPDKPVYAIPLHRALAVIIGLSALLALALLLTACGARLFDVPHAADAMPVTEFLGSVAAWLMPGLLIVVAGKLWASRRSDPARRTDPTLHIAGPDRLAIRRAARLVRRWGWKVRTAPAAREPGQVGIELVEPAQSEATEFDPRWPLKVSIADLEAGVVKERLDRRDEIKVRRQLFRGLQKLFKRACAFKGPAGGGFWLAPHWWFVEGVGREDADSAADDAPPLVGPPYHRILPPRARQHAHAVLRATQVDMIFVEDGVTYKNLERALRVLTELFDVHGGQKRAEELHFRGIPKVKVMIHEYEPGNPFHSDLYPEPKFDDLSRVRVLHIFRDRGGHEELIEPPFDYSSSPAPVGALG
ncbi:MAG: hypothetical protein L0241_06020 [Planctomycetia bacterium]|nr:hypothetical protein [Planctomycetia bacterium]